MMLYADDQSYKQRSAEFDAKRAAASALRKGAADMGALANGEPTPSDFMMLHDPVVSPDLRSAIIDARKRMWMKSPKDRLAYRDAISPLADAIQNLIDEHGFKYTPLMRLISPKSMPNRLTDAVIENHQVEAKMAKYDGTTHSCDLNYLVDPRIAPRLRRRLIDVKKALDDAPLHERRALAKTIAPSLVQQVDDLSPVIGPDGVAAIRRVLGRD
jgi:hypothetical protein